MTGESFEGAVRYGMGENFVEALVGTSEALAMMGLAGGYAHTASTYASWTILYDETESERQAKVNLSVVPRRRLRIALQK